MDPSNDLAFKPYLTAWRERLLEERARTAAAVAARRAAAGQWLDRFVETLVNQFGAQRVWLVGSLARGELGLDSDIDLAVAGIALSRVFEAERALEDLGGGFAIDLVPVEAARPRFLDALAREGRLLHDAR